MISWHLRRADNSDNSDIQHSDGVISLNEVSHDMSGDLTCTATNQEGQDSRSVLLKVVKASTAINNESEDITKDAGDNLSLDCDVEVDASIADTAVRKWFKDGKELGADRIKEDSVNIPYLMKGDSGEYRCDVSTAVDKVSIKRKVSVRTLPPSIHNLPSIQGGLEGDQLRIECRATGIPLPDLSFKHNDKEVSGESKVDGNQTVGSITVTEPGQYSCLAVNFYGDKSRESKMFPNTCYFRQ